MAETLYDTLGVKKGASPTRSRRRTGSSRAQYHPDANQGDKAAEERFKQVQNAYDVLSDAEKRKAYDRFGTTNGRRRARARRRQRRLRRLRLGDLGDILGGIFGGGAGGPRGGRGGRRSQPVRGADVETEVRLSFEDSLRGAEAKVPVELTVACSRVRRHGRAARDGAGDLPRVQRPRRQGREPGTVRALAAVPALPRQRHGDRAAVPEVQGLRPRAAAAHYTVKIKPGVKDGTKIRLKGKGEAGGHGGPAGDLDRRHARRRRRRCTSGAATTSSSRCRSRSRPPRSAASVEVPTPGGSRSR